MPQQPTDEWVEVPITNDEWIEVPVDDKPAAKEQPAPKQEKSAIPDYIANPIKVIQEKAEKKNYPAFAGGEEKNPYADKKAVVEEYLNDPANARDKSNYEYSQRKEHVDNKFGKLFGPGTEVNAVSKAQRDYEEHNLYLKAVNKKIAANFDILAEKQVPVKKDIDRLRDLVADFSTFQDPEEIKKQVEKGNLSPEQADKLIQFQESSFLEYQSIVNKPELQDFYRTAQSLEYKSKLAKQATDKIKAPELPAGLEIMLSLKGSIYSGISSIASRWKKTAMDELSKEIPEPKAEKKVISKWGHDIVIGENEAKMFAGMSDAKDVYDLASSLEASLNVETEQWMPRSQMPIDPTTGKQKLADWGDREMATQVIPNTVGSMLTLVAPGVALGVGASMLAPEAAPELAPLWKNIWNATRSAGVATVSAYGSRALEKQMESGGWYAAQMRELMDANPDMTEQKANEILTPGFNRIEALNQKMVLMDAAQYAVALMPLAKWLGKVGPLGKLQPYQLNLLSAIPKVAFEGTTEFYEEDIQGLLSYQEDMRLKGKLPPLNADDSVWKDFLVGYEDWKKTPERKQATEQGALMGGIMGGGGEIINFIQDYTKQLQYKKALLDETLKVFAFGNKEQILKQQEAMQHDLFAENAIAGTSETLKKALTTLHEKQTIGMTEEERATADEEFKAQIATIDDLAAQAKGLRGIQITPQSKKSILLLDAYGKQLEIEKQKFIAEHQTKGVNPGVLAEYVAREFDSRIAENERTIKDVTKEGIEEFKRKQELKNEFALPLEEAKPEPVQVDLRDEKIKQDFRNRSNTPNVKDLLEDRPETFDDVVATVKRGEEVVPEKRAEVEEYIKEKEQLLAELKENPERLFLSEDIQKAQDFIQNAKDILAVKEEKVVEPIVEKKPVKKAPSDIEAKKADIERRRQEELNSENYRIPISKETRTWTDEDGVKFETTITTFKDGSKQTTNKNLETGGVTPITKYSKDLSNEKIYEVEAPNAIERGEIKQQQVQEAKIVGKINAKYDAELDALEKPVEEDKPLPAREQKAAEKVVAANKEKIAEVSEKAKEKIESLKLKAKKYDEAEAADLEELKRLAAERKKIADKKKNLGIVAQGPEEAGKEMAEEFDNYVKTAKIYLRMGARKGVRTVEEFAEKIGEAVNDVIKKAFAQAKTEYDDERGYNKEQAGHYQTEGERIAAEQQRDESGRVTNERDEFGLSDVKASIKLYDLFRTLDANKDNKGLFARTLQQGYAIIQKQDISSDEKNFAYKEFKQMLMSAFEIPLTGNKQEDFDILEAQGFTVEDANFLTEEYDVLFFGDFTNGNEVNKVRHLYAPVNENGELVGLKDANGDIIPERKIYDMILDYSNSVKGFPENLTEFYSKMAEKSLANQLAKQKESDLVSLFNVFSSSKRKPFYYLSSFDGKLKMLPSNKERFDYSLVSALEEKVKKKYPAEVIKEKAAKFIEQKQALNAKNRVIQDKVGKLYAEFQKANLNKKYAEAEQIKQSILPLIKDIISNEAAFMEKITGISADMWIKGTNTQEVLSGVTGKGKGNVSTWMKNWIISAQTFQDFINKLIVKQGTFGLSQIDSLVKNIIKNPENTSLVRNFIGIDGKSQNSDLFISYVDIALDDIASPEVQNNPKNKDNEFVKFFKDRAPQTAVFEGEKNDQDNDVATTNDIPTGDLLISMVQAFMDGMAKPTYMQFLEQQKDNASKVMVEAPTFKVDDKTQLLLEQNGLSAGIAAQVKFVQDKLIDFIMSAQGTELDLKGRSTLDIAKAFTWNWALNKKFMDDYLQPETDTKGNKNYKNYQDKTKRSIDNKGYHLNSRILTEKLGRPNMNMVVLDDPRAVIKIAPSFSDDMKELADGTYFVRDKAEDAIKDASGSLLGISKSFKFTYTDHNQDNTRTFLKGHGITLTKELAEFNPTYKALYEYMEKNDVDFLAFDSAVKKYDKAKQVKATWQNETHLAKEVPFAKNNVIELNPKYLLVQQDLRQESTFDDARVTRQQFYYAMRFNKYDKIQEIFNGIVKDKYDDFKAEFVSKSEKEQKEFLKGLLTSGSDKYDLYRSFLSNKKSSLHSIYFQPIMRNILSGYVKKRIMSLDVNKQISIEAPLLGGFRDEKGKLHNLKSVRIEDGKIKPGQVLVPTAYQTQGFKKGDVIFISRVPSTELHSITPLEIVGFLPESLGNIIMTDQGTRIGAGADYDGDMRHVWGKYKNDRGIDIMGNTYEAKINQVFDLMLEAYLGKALSGQELENQFTMITQPIDTGANKDMIKNHQERLAKDLSKDSIKSFLSQVESSQDGKRTIGIGARFNAIYALLEKHGASLPKEISFPGFTINKEGKPVKNNKSISLSDFSHPDFEKQHSIRSVLANFLNHSTDNPTLGNLEPMGINRYTTSLAYMLDALGMEEQQIYDYLNHPIVRNYVALARKYSSPYYKLSKQEVFQFMVDKVKENESNYSPTDNWASKYKKLYPADIVATSGQGALKFIAMMDYMMGIADSLTDLSQLEALANDPVVDSNKFFTMKEKKKRLKENKVNYEPNKLRKTVYLNNSTIALEWFNDFGKFYYPVMSNVGEQMYQEIRKASFIDPKVKGIIENRGLEDAMHQQFLINALNITESRAELAKKAKEVYDEMEETDPLKKLLKWDSKNNRLSVKEEYKHSLNESEKKEFRDEFEKLRGLASISDKFKGKIFGDLEEPWTILLNHQIKEYGWNPSPRSGEYASFMDVGTHAIVSDMMKQEFDRWNNGGVDDTRMGMMDAMVKQMQLRNTNLIPQVHYQDGVLMSAKNLEIKQGTGYVKIGQGETAKIYNLEDLLNGKKDNFYTLPKGKYEMLPIEEFKNPIEVKDVNRPDAGWTKEDIEGHLKLPDKTKKESPVAKKYQGKIIYASPASGKTGMVQQLKAQGIEDVIDFDNLLAIQYNKVMAERISNPSFDVATGDTVGKLIWNPKADDGRGAGAIRDWGYTDVQVSTQKAPVKVKNTTLNLYVPAIKEAQRLASEGKTVLMGSKAWIKNSIPLGNGQTFDFEVDYAFPSSKEADTRMMEQREMTEYDLNKFREGEQSQIKSLPTEKVQDMGTQKIGEVILNKTSDNNNLEDDTDETINKCNPKK